MNDLNTIQLQNLAYAASLAAKERRLQSSARDVAPGLRLFHIDGYHFAIHDAPALAEPVLFELEFLGQFKPITPPDAPYRQLFDVKVKGITYTGIDRAKAIELASDVGIQAEPFINEYFGPEGVTEGVTEAPVPPPVDNAHVAPGCEQFTGNISENADPTVGNGQECAGEAVEASPVSSPAIS
jgi:hypothetical protein